MPFVTFFFCIDDLAFDMEKIYHVCLTKIADGTNKIIGPGEQCLIPTSNPSWKQPKIVVLRHEVVQTRNLL